jgi:hypothetical protein
MTFLLSFADVLFIPPWFIVINKKPIGHNTKAASFRNVEILAVSELETFNKQVTKILQLRILTDGVSGILMHIPSMTAPFV